jgi:glycerol kinase
LDQGSTSSKALILDKEAKVVAISRNFPVRTNSPRAGWLECDPSDMLETLIGAGRDVIEKAGIQPAEIAAVGLANQGETVIAFHRKTGKPLYPAISWQDRRTSDIVALWQRQGLDEPVSKKTGLRLDPYFAASKMHWILENVEEAYPLLRQNALGLATSDAWLISRLTGGKAFVTDRSTASRTMLLNLYTLDWDMVLLEQLGIPREALPELVPNTAVVGNVHQRWFGSTLPLCGLCVDQQAALFGEGCHQPGQAKLTYGTGCFMLANVGPHPELRAGNLLTSVGWQMEDETQYVFDGGIYTAGSVVEWMIGKLELVGSFPELDKILGQHKNSEDPFFIPALSGLAAPYWKPDMKGAWFGLTFAHDRSSLMRAALEAIAFRVKDIFDLMVSSGLVIKGLKTDGGLTRSKFLMQYQADLLGVSLETIEMTEATAFGIGLFSGLAISFWPSPAHLPSPTPSRVLYQPDRRRGRAYLRRYRHWRRIVEEVISWQKLGIRI